MRKFGYTEKARGYKFCWQRCMGNDARSFKEEITDQKIKKEMTKEFIDCYSKNINQYSKPLEGCIDFLVWAKKNNISLAVCTNKQKACN